MRSDKRSVDRVSVCIDAKLSDLDSIPLECYIFNVHYQLCSDDEKAYELEMFVIGFLPLWLIQAATYGRAQIAVSKVAFLNADRKAMNLSIDELLEVILLDGCFINEQFWN
ncbi:hypothetical protein ACOSQ3_015961 [Xanthoceras sorbifolium]